jgi:PAS domain S-box-containing protein
MQVQKNITRIITWLSGIVAIMVVIIFPIVYFFTSYEFIAGSLETEGKISAQQIMKIIAMNPRAWEYEQERLQVAISNYPRTGYMENWRTLNARNEVIAESLNKMDAPVIMRSFELMDSGIPVGRLEIYRSLRPLLMQSGMIAVFMLPVGIGVFLIIRFLPIRTIYKTEEALRKSRQLLEKTFASLHDAVLIIDAQTSKIIDCNPAAVNIFGYKREELLGRTTEFLYINDVRLREFGSWLESAIRQKGFLLLPDFPMKRGDGKVFPAEHTVLPLENERHERIGWVQVIRDITERKKMEGEVFKAQKLESLGILAGGIAHDFNNLLTAILGSISLLKMYGKSHDESYQILEQAEKASMRAKALTQQLLTFAKGGEPFKKTLSIAELLRDSASFGLRGSNVKCEFSIPDDLWPVTVDEGQISQVINNIVINADQAMPEGGIIKINACNLLLANDEVQPLREGKYIKFDIEDRGVGIPVEYLQKIFDPFFTTKRKGSGLGLATAYSVIKKHEGHIAVESEIGKGTTFTFYLPASKEELVQKKSEGPTALKGKGKILLMDDEDLLRNFTARMLERIGYEMESASDGSEAIELYAKAKASEKPFDAVIMDLTIPGGIGGQEALKKLSEIDPHVKAIASSGYSNDPVISGFGDYGFMGVIIKPYRIEELSDILSKVIGRHDG